MLVAVTVLLSLLGAVVCRPPSHVPIGNFSTDPISERDREFLRRLPSHRVAYPSGFRIMYMAQDGHIVHGNRPQGNYIKIVGSPLTSQGTLDYAANEIHKMLRLSPQHIFTNLASRETGFGIFSRQEKLTVFPEYAYMKDTPQCHGTCAGSCSHTCTFDGRKWDTVAGAGGRIAVVIEDNVMCTSNDPYYRHDNILIHEFAHVVDGYGFSSTENQQNDNNYNHAKANSLWRLSSYAMANSAEYFAESTGAFFAVHRQSSAGGMNECGGTNRFCTSESEARYHIYQTDVQLYNLLVQVYTNGRPTEPSGLSVCPSRN